MERNYHMIFRYKQELKKEEKAVKLLTKI
jgi:hypothetical protein